MRSLILSLLFVAMSVMSNGQAFETCLAAESAPEALAAFPHTEMIIIDPAWTSDVEYIPTGSPIGALSVAYWSFSISAPDYYNIDLQTTLGATIVSDVSVGISDGTVSACPMDASTTEIFSGILMAGSTVSGGCTFLTAGTYTMAFAVNQGNEGEIEVLISSTTGPSNETCDMATEMFTGPNTGSNTCSNGLVWYSYTVINGGSVSLTPSISSTGNDITSPVISQVIIGDGISSVADCGNTPEPAGTTSWTCLSPGDVIYFEAGDDLAPIEQGDFTITIIDDPSLITNETCADVMATPTPAPTCETTTLTTPTTNTTMGACPDNFAGCPTFETESTVWFAFSTSADAQTVDIEITNGSISGTEFALIDATAGCPTMGSPATAIGGCQTTGSLLNQMITGGNTYYIAVSTTAFGTDGDFTLTVTPSNPPLNDECATGAIDITATAAAGVDGTTACATSDILDFCAAVTEDHVVYYTYTVDASITTNRTVTITTTGAVVPVSGTNATSLGFGIWADCAGTAPTMPSGANLLPLTGTDLCDPLSAPIVYECVEPGTSFTIAVASTDMMEGDFNIMITEEETGSATNDVCDIANNPDITSVAMGTNFCADGELNFCGMTFTTDHQVWYTYTNTTGSNVDLGLTFTGTGAPTSATDLSMLVLTGDCSNTAFPGTTDSDFCNILDAGEQVISCIENGETISILLGSPEDATVTGPEGNFNIAFNEISNSPVNDECTGAIDITPPTCEWTLASTLTPSPTAEFACPEDFLTFPAGCDFTMESTVWYSITIPNDGGTYSLEFQNISDDAFLTVFEDTGGDCDDYGTPSINADCETGAGPHGDTYDNLTNGATYFIAVGDPTTTGGFDFEIKLNLLPDNDECANAVALVGGTPTDGTTSCATQPVSGEYNSGVCTDNDETNTVFYTYEVPASDKGFHVTITGAAVGGLMGDINLVVFEDDPAGACATGPGATIVGEVCTTSTTLNEEFECVGPGTYVIRVSTSEDNEGDFQITITPLALEQPNDNCDAPDMSLNPGMDCIWQTVTANTIGACPEDMNLDPGMTCSISTGPTVWYEITAPANADFLDLQINTDGGSNPFIAVFPGNPADCDNQTFLAGSTCYEGLFTDLIASGNTLIPVTAGDTYLVAVGVSDPAGVMFEFGIKWITPPDNDECVDAIALAGGVATDGTTLCATQPISGEYNSTECTDADETNTVFYTYEVPASDKGFHVTISAAAANGFSGDVNLVVFEDDPAGSCATGPGGTVVEEVCTISTALNDEFECVGPGTYVIRVSTSGDNEGDFQITITPLALEQPNDNCDAPNTTDFAAALECEWMIIDANTTGACPEDMNLDGPNCGLDDFPVTWYEATAPANAEFLDLQINTGGLNPFIAIFESGLDCDNLTYVAGSTCYQGTFDELNDLGAAQVDITPGATYLIAIGTDIDGGANINFGIKWITPPANDECTMAEVLTPVAGTTGPIPGTTQCATVPLTGSMCDDDKINTVWYTYTVETDVKEITIDITNWDNTVATGTPDFSVAVLDGCPPSTFINQVDGTPADYCGGEGTDLITLSCLAEGDVITILVSSSSENEGTFDITLNTSIPECTYTNDECANASPLTGNPDPLITDDPSDCVLVAGCNDLACTEFTFGACAGIDQINTVFYTFTTDANVDPIDGAFVNIEILNGQAGELDAPGAVLFEGTCDAALSIGACGAGAGGEYNSGPLGGPGVIQPNTTYTIMIFNSDPNQNGGTFDLCVTVTSGCVNDDICDAFTLEPGVTVDNPASSVGCTDDFDVSGCGVAQNEATLWYQVDIPEGATSIDIMLSNQPVDGVTGDVSISVGPLVDCNNLDVNDVLYTECAGFGNHNIPCVVEYGTYWIQIGSEDEMEAGDFTITYNFNLDPDPANDICSTAEDLVVTDICEFVTFPGTLKDACPELFDLGACEYSMNQSVWYTLTIPAGPPTVTDIDIEIMGLASPMIGVFEFDCANAGDPAFGNGVVASTMNADGDVDCSQMELTEGIVVTPGTTYHILVSSSANEDTPFDINIRLNAPPINDDPCINSMNPPFDLTGGGSHAGTTCCARGSKDTNPDGSVADWENEDPCNDSTEDAAVWYMFTPNPDDAGYDIIVNGGSISNQMTVQVYATTDPASLCNGVPTGDGVLASSCSDLAVEIRIPNCDPALTYFVKVTTSDDDCGEFDINVSPASVCDYADTCDEATDALETSTQESCEDPLEFFTIPGCLDLACPEETANCMENQGPTVWFKINIDDPEATKLITQVDAPGFEAVWQVFEGTSCADLAPVAEQLVIDGTTQTFNCSNSDGDSENIFQTPIDPDALDNGLMYWVSVTALGEITDPTFDFVYNSTLGCLACTGEDATDCGNGEFVASVLEDGVWVEVPDDFQFCQGIDVQVCFEFNYNTTGSGNDWIHGFVPFFGPGWDVNDDVLAAAGPLGNFEFFSSQGDCAPFLNGYGLPNVCTYIDDEGFLQLCNSACDPAGCPCTGEGGMQDGDPLPSGFWYNTPGNGSNCGQLGCTPASWFGWPSGTNVDVSECIELKTKVFDSVEECEANNSLSFGIQTFSDAVSGCWVDSSPCIVDPSVGKFDWVIQCNVPPPVDGEDAEICNEGVLDILLLTADGSPTEIQVDVIDNPSVSGENSHTFPGGSGTIDDMLTNNSTTEQIVEYIVYSVDPNLECPGARDTIEVTIYAELVVEFDPVFVCEDDCTDITPNIIGGAGMPFMYEWSTGEVTPSINVCPIVPTTYFVTVTDILGCEGIGEVEVDVKPPVEALLPETIAVCKDDNFDPFNPDYIVCLDFISGSSPYAVTWDAPIGLAGQAAGNFGECFAINEVTSSELLGSPLGVYTLTANITDFFGCMGTVDMEVTITGELTIVPDVIPYDCGETEASMNVTGIDAAGNPVTTFLLYGGCPDDGLGDFIDEYLTPSGTVLISPLDLLQYDCYTIVAQTESGCQATIDVELPISEGTPIDIGGDEAVCVGNDATISIANEGDFTSFVWTPNIGSTGSITFTPDSTTTYIVEATDALGCVSTALWSVDVNPEPTISLAGALEFCENGTATITASGGVSYEWTGIAGNMSGPDYTTGVAGDATVTVTDINGCVSDSMITFTQVDVIEILLDNANICDGMGDTLFVPDNIINVVWQDAVPNTVSDTNFYVITTPGTFTVTGQDAATGCDAAGSFTVEEFITPVINIPDTVNVCRQDSGIDSLCIDLLAIASGSSTGTWAQDGIIPGFTFSDFTLDNVCFEDIQTGCYPFTFTTNSAQAPCMDVMETLMVCVQACPCPSAAIDTVPDLCNLGSYNLELEEITEDPGTWSVESGPVDQDLTDIITGTTFNSTGILEGEYIVRFTLDNPGGGQCEQYQQDTFNVIGQEIINAIAPGQLCNIENQQFPTSLDLYDLINVDASNGGTWVQTSMGATINITGGSTISSTGITDFSETFTFEYTSGDTGGPCPPTVTEVMVNIFDCTCPILIVGMDTLCNDGLPIDLFTLLTNDDNLPGTWTADGGALEGASMFNPDGLPSDVYNVTFTLDSSPGAGCETEFSNVVVIRRQAVANMVSGPLPCTMDTGNGPTTVNLYDWLQSGYTLGSWTQTGGDNLMFNDDGNSIAIVDFMGQDIDEEFTFTFTTDGAQEPCENIVVDIVIAVQDCNCPPIALSDPEPICNDSGTSDLCSLIGGSDPGTFTVFDQSGNDESASIDGTGCIFNATDLNPGLYDIVYTLDQIVTGTCTQSDTVTIEVMEFVDAELLPNPEVCNDINGNGTLAVNFFDFVVNSGDGVWTDVDGAGVDLSSNLALTNVNFANGNNGGPVPAGTYTFTFEIDNADPCGDVFLEMEVVVVEDCNCAPINPETPATECSTDGPVDLTQYDDPTMPGTWSSTELTIENGNSLITDGVAAGTYELTYTIDNPTEDCDSIEVVSIVIGTPANPGTPLEELRFCEGESETITLDDRLMDADDNGVWSETSAVMSTGFSGNTFNTDGQAPGTYTFQYSIDFASTDPCPAVDASVTIIIDPNPISDAGDEMFIDCVTTSADLGTDNTSTGSEFVYSWTLDGEEVGTMAMLADITVEGTYTLLVTNSNTGCTAESSVVVMKSDDLPTFVGTEIQITCNGDNDGAIVISDQNGGDGNYTYMLNGGNEVTDPNSFTGLTPGDYTITMEDGAGCSTEQSFVILEPAPVSVEIAGEEILTGQPGDEFILTIDPIAENIDSVVWTDFNDPSIIFCSGSAEDCLSITLSPTLNTTSVYVEVFDANGCSANDQVQIQLTQIVDVIFPNIITPNGDNTNDFFFIASKDVEQVLSMSIFDRWGELIWQKKNFDPRVPSEGWDGKFNDNPVVPGVYVFTVEVLFNDLNNTQETFSGDVTVTDGE